jgi:hypothetical protein
LCHQSENLSIAIKVINTILDTAFRIRKNLWVWKDCHTYTKLFFILNYFTSFLSINMDMKIQINMSFFMSMIFILIKIKFDIDINKDWNIDDHMGT